MVVTRCPSTKASLVSEVARGRQQRRNDVCTGDLQVLASGSDGPFGRQRLAAVVPEGGGFFCHLRQDLHPVVVVCDYRNGHADLPNLMHFNEEGLLVPTVAAANPRTIVVIASGGSVLMPWRERVSWVLVEWAEGGERRRRCPFR